MLKRYLLIIILFMGIPSYSDEMPLYQLQNNNVNTNAIKNTQTTTIKINNKKIITVPQNTKTFNIKNTNSSNGTYIKINTRNDINNNANIQNNNAFVQSNSTKTYYSDLSEENVTEEEKLKNHTNYLKNQQVQFTVINDPYMLKVGIYKYYMVKNSFNNEYTLNNILGYGDKKISLFSELRKLDVNNDKKITSNELKKLNIRFVRLDFNNKLLLNDKSKDFNLDNISYIDLSNTRESINNGVVGSFGYFDVYIKQKNGSIKKIVGCVTFETDNELKEFIK